MQCLWITRQDPRAANSGELIHSLGLIRAFSAQPGVKLTILAHQGHETRNTDAGVDWQLHGHIPEGRLLSLASRLPGDAFRLGNRRMRGALSALIQERKWDWLIIDQAACGWALELLPENARIAYIAHNHEAEVRRQVAGENHPGNPLLALAMRRDARKYGNLESRICGRASCIAAITPRDAAAFTEKFPGKPVIVLTPGYDGHREEPLPDAADKPRRVLLAGAFEWIAKRRNLEAFLQAAEKPFRDHGIGFQIVGKASPDYFSRLAARHPWADFQANVPAIPPFLAQARIGLIPEALGGGFKLKALEYIFAGLPVASIDTALSGLPVDPETEAISAPDITSLAGKIARCIDDTARLTDAARRAAARCENHFHWGDRGRDLSRMLEGIAP